MASVWHRRVDAADWQAVTAELNDVGGALLPTLLSTGECAALRDLYGDDRLFRATIDMGRHRYGRGEFRYFDRPYPQPIDALKQALYPRLLPIARDWWTKLRRDTPWPDELDDWLDMCHRAGQTKPTALMLKYGTGDWNALHRDLYGELVFRFRSSSISTSRASRTPGASSYSSSNGPEPSRAARRPCSRAGTVTSSPRGNGPSARPGDGPPPRCATGSRWSAPVSATPSA